MESLCSIPINISIEKTSLCGILKFTKALDEAVSGTTGTILAQLSLSWRKTLLRKTF